MDVLIGTNGKDHSWQKDFKEEVKCSKCKKPSRMLFRALS